MSIDKDSDGLPGVNVHRRTTKVNLWMIAAILAFFAVSALAAFVISRQSATPADKPPKVADEITGTRP